LEGFDVFTVPNEFFPKRITLSGCGLFAEVLKVSALLELPKKDALPSKGFIRNEHVPFKAFIANRFGKHDA